MTRIRLLTIAMVLFAAVPVFGQGQEGNVRQVESPFQEGYAYTVGEDLDPLVEVGDLRWAKVAVTPRDDREIVAGEEIPVFVYLEFENLSEYNRKAQVILLFEDADGRPLGRLPLDDLRVGGGRFEEDRQKHKIDGALLLDVARLYLFCEVQ